MIPTLLVALAIQTPASTRADTLRGAWDTPGRVWWDVTFYDLHVRVSPADSTVRGHNRITFTALARGRLLQIDLMEPLTLDSVTHDGTSLPLTREGNAWFAMLPADVPAGTRATVTAFYHGSPHIAVQPPWDGGITWTADSLGRPWVVTTDQGLGASVWWPNKDTQADEPDSQRVAITVPDPLINVSNGRLRSTTRHDDGTTTYEWFVTNPINNYAIALATGHYAHYQELFQGEGGELTLDFWPLDYHEDAARRQFAQTPSVLRCFEHWFGPYPWYEDGFKLIEVPYNGMEHQSAVAYGNGYANGYRGRDMSRTGWGMRWDFIIVHETAHEWWGNNITTRDMADMWVHESFGNYAEGLYTECLFGKQAGAEYIIGNRNWIANDVPIIPPYGVNAEGSGDMYPKGGQLLHTIRQLVGDDARWRAILRGLNATFRHRVVTGAQVEQYISRESGLDLSRVFDQYLRTTMVPVLEYRLADDTLHYRWTDVVPGFAMPVEASGMTLRPTERWQAVPFDGAQVEIDPDYYVNTAPRRSRLPSRPR